MRAPANPEKIKAYSARWYVANKERIKDKRARLRKLRREKENARARERYAERGDAARMVKNRWRKKNPEKLKEIRIRYLSADPGRAHAACAKWSKAHPEAIVAISARRRARLRKAKGNHTAADILALLPIQKNRCAHSWCRKSLRPGYHVDHIIALACGGANDRRNLQLLCPSCNVRKSTKHPVDVAQSFGLLL